METVRFREILKKTFKGPDLRVWLRADGAALDARITSIHITWVGVRGLGDRGVKE